MILVACTQDHPDEIILNNKLILVGDLTTIADGNITFAVGRAQKIEVTSKEIDHDSPRL